MNGALILLTHLVDFLTWASLMTTLGLLILVLVFVLADVGSL